jgi:hypothetical protein
MRRLLPLAFGAVLAFTPTTALAQVDLGAQLNWGTESAGLAIGGRLHWIWPWEPGTAMVSSFDYFLPDDFDLWEVNVNLAHTIPLQVEEVSLYAGAGFNWAHYSNLGPFDVSDNDYGLNLLAGVRYLLPSITPYGEVRVEVGGGERVIFTGGVMFDLGTD